jgi:hypothetical protein
MTTLWSRWRLRAAVGVLAVGLLVGVASRVLDGDPAKGIHVRWHAEVTDAERLELEAQFLLRGERREDRTFGYDLLDDSQANIQALVAHPAVEDTHHIDRGNFTLAANAEFGESRTGWAWRRGVEDQLPLMWRLAGLLVLIGSGLLIPWSVLGRSIAAVGSRCGGVLLVPWRSVVSVIGRLRRLGVAAVSDGFTFGLQSVRRVSEIGRRNPAANIFRGSSVKSLWRSLVAWSTGSGSTRVTPAFMRRDERLIVLVAAPLQLLVLYMVPLVFECDARAYYEWSAATTYRPPLMTGLLLFTGQYHLDTFLVTVLAHAIFGVLSCLLVYWTLVPLTRWGALVAAMAYVLSLVPFTAAKLMLSEQLFTVVVLWAVYCLSRYWFSEERRYIGWTIVAGLAAMFTRWEGQAILLCCCLTLFVWAWSRGHVRTWVTWVTIVAVTCVGWSYYRARAMEDMRVFGTLQNGTADQLFWNLYGGINPIGIYRWEQVFDSAVRAQRQQDPPEVAQRYTIVRLENGPATQELAETIRRIVRERPTEQIFSTHLVDPGSGGYLTRLGGSPDRLVSEIFAAPSNTYVFSVPGELRSELGPRAASRLLMAVNLEAISHHPAYIVSRLSQMLSLVGVDILPQTLLVEIQDGWTLASFRPVMNLWSDQQYYDVPYDLAGCASGALPARMLDEYQWDRALPRATASFVPFLSVGRNWLRNIVGPLFLVSVFLIPFARSRGLLVTIYAAAVGLIVIVGTLGGGADSRYEYAVLPLLLIVTTGAMPGAVRLWDVVRRRVHRS